MPGTIVHLAAAGHGRLNIDFLELFPARMRLFIGGLPYEQHL